MTPKVQPLSVDEAYLDIIGCGDPETVVANLRRSIYEQTGVTASAGIARNVLVARVATGKAKPNGQLLVNGAYRVGQHWRPCLTFGCCTVHRL